MKVFHSIRWRLQLWHGVLLALVLAGFGATAWRLDRATRLQRVDRELERRVGAIVNAVRPPGPAGRAPRGGRPDRPDPRDDAGPRGETGQPPPPPSPGADPPGGPSRGGLRLGQREAALFQADGGEYYVVWDRRGEEIGRSASAPAGVPRPEPGGERRESRSRGTLREYVHFTEQGESILVGRDIRDEWDAIRQLAWVLAAVGLAVFGAGLAGGWWVSNRALRPIAGISASARRISTGDLTHRIPVPDAGSELADLARVLNETFARLQASFDRQRQFTADASHELRTPVSVVLTQAQSALARERSAEEYREALVACGRSAQRMRRLLESLLTLARLDSSDAGVARRLPCDLEALAAEAIEQCRHDAEQREVTLELDASPASCIGDPAQLAQVAANLVSNAIHYNRPGGAVNVSCRAEGDFAVLSVKDTGSGIAAADLPHIFERFYRADKARSGGGDRTGLGLAIAKALVDAHGGRIDVSSEPGRGSIFTVRFPTGPGSTSRLPD